MKQLFGALIAMMIFNGSVWADANFEEYQLLDISRGKKITLSQALPDLRKKRIIFVGEYHDQKSHHVAQLKIIQAIHGSGVPVAIGLEMFRTDSQNALDRWVSGKMSERDFQGVYYENWNSPWPLYSMIFEYAREMKIPLVGLNVPRAITMQVAQGGFQSLSKEEKEELPNVVCKVDRDYMAFVKRAYGAHAHGQLNFTYFCEAQLVWDKVMAINALAYLKAHPNFSMILLTGTGHAWKKGIPAQVRQRSELPYSVIFPQIARNIEPGTVSGKDADYIILDSLGDGLDFERDIHSEE
jgi:uncharacterized iron-regulated protein